MFHFDASQAPAETVEVCREILEGKPIREVIISCAPQADFSDDIPF
jgi:hypothetical protein